MAPGPASAERELSAQASAGTPPALQLDAGSLTVTFSGRAQLQLAVLAGEDALLSDGDLAEEAGFRLRRARLGMTAEYDKSVSIGVEVDLLESQGSALHEAYIGWENPWALAYGGLVKAPLSRSALTSSDRLQMAERAIGIRGIAPVYQLGVLAGGRFWDQRIRILTGAFNGMQRESTFAGGYSRINPSLGNRFGGVAFAARLDIEPLGLLGPGIADLSHSETPRVGIGGGLLINRGKSIHGMAYSGDLAFKWMGVSLLAEFIQDASEPADEPTQPSTLAAKTKRRVIVGQLGYAAIKDVLDISARVERVDENMDIEDEGDFMAIAGAASLYLAEGHLKVQLFYQHRREQHGKQRKNDALLLQTEGRF
jgi:hypothetical protein